MPWLRDRLHRWLQWPHLTADIQTLTADIQTLRNRVDFLERIVMQRDEPEGSVRDTEDRRHGGHWPDAHLGAQ